MKLALGIDTGGTKIRAGLVWEDGRIQRVTEIKTEAEKGSTHVVNRILSLVESFSDEEITGVGIGTTGQVGLDGTILSATKTIPGWAGIQLQKTITQQTNFPAKVVNDVQAMALGELFFGDGQGIEHFLCLALGTGVGGAIVCDGKLFRGASGAAGEMGHLVIHSHGRPCPCGKKGCLEAYISGTALSERYTERLGVKKSASEFFEDARINKPEAKDLFNQFLDDLVCGLASLGAIFNPQRIILGGGLGEKLTEYLPEIKNRLRNELSTATRMHLRVSVSKLGGSAMILGAASLIFEGGN